MALYLSLSLDEYRKLIKQAVENIEKETERQNKLIIDEKLKKL